MATGRPLVISLARYATPIRQYSVFPLSFAARGVRPLMPRNVGWCSTGGILHTVGAAAAQPLPQVPHAPVYSGASAPCTLEQVFAGAG